jgi:hypothetical protein
VPYGGEYIINFEVIELGFSRKDIFQQLPEGRDVPLSMPKVEDGVSYSLTRCYPGWSFL